MHLPVDNSGSGHRMHQLDTIQNTYILVSELGRYISKVWRGFKDLHVSLALWLILFAASWLSVADVWHGYALRGEGLGVLAGIICFAALKADILTCLLGVLQRWRVAKIIIWCFIGVYIMLCLINGVGFYLYDLGISRTFFTILFETNPEELREFIPGLLSNIFSLLRNIYLWIAVAFIILIIVGLRLFKHRFKSARAIQDIFKSIMVVMGAGGIIYIFGFLMMQDSLRANQFIFLRTCMSVKSVIDNQAQIKRLSEQLHPLPFPETAKSEYKADNVILIIGESASRDHLSIYGYPLATTPRADAMRDSIYIFTDAVAPSTKTANVMPRLLTFMPDSPDAREWYDYPGMLPLFKALGYHTAWISNQERTGKWSNLSGILSQDADEVNFIGPTATEDYIYRRYDEGLLAPFRKSLTQNMRQRQLICLHLMGSHNAYAARYPEDRNHITADDELRHTPHRPWLTRDKAAVVAQYDNSIAYTDSIVAEIIHTAANLDKPSIVVYLSDHGDNVYDDRDFVGRDPKYVKVPLIVYANKAYVEKNPEIIKAMQKALHKPLSTASLIHMLLTLTGSSYHSYDARQDVLSPQFRPSKRYVDGVPMF